MSVPNACAKIKRKPFTHAQPTALLSNGAGCSTGNRATKTKQRQHPPKCSEDLRSVECLQTGIHQPSATGRHSTTPCFPRYCCTSKDSSLPHHRLIGRRSLRDSVHLDLP